MATARSAGILGLDWVANMTVHGVVGLGAEVAAGIEEAVSRDAAEVIGAIKGW